MAGFYTMQRNWRFHEVFENDPKRLVAWIWMVETASFAERHVYYKHRTWPLNIGQFVTSINDLTNHFKQWGFTKQNCRTFLKQLKKSGLIDTEGNKHGTVITICNYVENYSGKRTDNTDGKNQTTSKNQTSNNQNKESYKEGIKNCVKEGEEGTRIEEAFPGVDPICSSEWSPALPKSWHTYAEQKGFHNKHIIEMSYAFYDYWIAIPDEKGRKKDWDASWRRWCRKEDIFN